VARLRRELENMLQALAWCSQAREGAHKQPSLVNALQSFWFHSGLLQLGYEVTRAATGHEEGSDTARVDALMSAAELAIVTTGSATARAPRGSTVDRAPALSTMGERKGSSAFRPMPSVRPATTNPRRN
jgi:hypothetical protein